MPYKNFTYVFKYMMQKVLNGIRDRLNHKTVKLKHGYKLPASVASLWQGKICN